MSEYSLSDVNKKGNDNNNDNANSNLNTNLNSNNDNINTNTNVIKKKPVNAQPGKVLFWSGDCKYTVIMDRVKKSGWKATDSEKKESKCNIFWVDVALIHERFKNVLPWQIVNHIPGMNNIARKNRMAQHLNKMHKLYPIEYSFYPRTWVLPQDMTDFKAQFDNYGNSLQNKYFIVKPDAGCQGKGIFITRSLSEVPSQDVVAQTYIKKPLLIDNFKFDLRLYVLVSSVKPLRMYMFQDGLVRLCTEEYVKPTKQNISQSCMHLTNYAVNKHNENYQYADSGEDDEGSKRSLKWFMENIKQDYGEEKAAWLWKRMGTLAVRTVIAILPTLTREYDQTFKSFDGIPTKINSFNSVLNNKQEAKANGNSSNDNNSSGDTTNRDEENSSSSSSSSSIHKEKKEDDDQDEFNVGADGRLLSGLSGKGKSNGGESSDSDDDRDDDKSIGSDNGDASSSSNMNRQRGIPKVRGSRCFEVLGIDIMLDSALKPWLIECNHLPSFGTDSPLDLDIKNRLIEQVFRVLPARADDEQAYKQWHKEQADRRLKAERPAVIRAKENKEREEQERIQKEKDRAERRRQALLQERARREAEEKARREAEEQARLDAERRAQLVYAPADADRVEEIKGLLEEIYVQCSPEKVSKIDRLIAKYTAREEEFLAFVLEKYNINKPGLVRYVRIVPEVSADASTYNSTGGDTNTEASADGSVANETDNSDKNTKESDSFSNDQNSKGTPDNSSSTKVGQNGPELIPRPPRKSRNDGSGSGPSSKRNSRSLSPPPGPQRRAQAIWKTAAEDDGFKQEVSSMIFPDENEEWLNFEIKRLTEFTRIFPPPPPSPGTDETESKVKEEADNATLMTASENTSALSSPPAGGTGESGTINGGNEQEDGEDEEDEEDDETEADVDNGNANSEVNIKAQNQSKTKKHKAAPYEDLILHAFVHDRRQTLRMRAPLANRQRPSSEENQGSLPPLHAETSRGFVHGTVAHNMLSRGGPGWRAPPRIDKKKIERVPTQNQSEAAQRLSQGLSSSHNKNVTTRNTNKSRITATSRLPAGVMLDQGSESSMMGVGSLEYSLPTAQQAMDTLQYNPNQLQAAGAYGIKNASVLHGQQTLAAQQMLQYGRGGNPGMEDLPPRIRRLMEESRQARVRFEASRVQAPASVLRQQQFRFDESPGYVAGAQSFSLTAATNLPRATGAAAPPIANGQQGVPSVPYPVPVIPQSPAIGPTAFTLPEPTNEAPKGSVTGNGSIQRSAIHGRRSPTMMQQTVQSNIHPDGGSVGEQATASVNAKLGTNVTSAPLHPNDIALAKRRLQSPHAASGKTVVGGEGTNDANDEKMLQDLFPGWF